MSYKKSFLVFVLAFAALTLGRSQEARGQWGWDWGDLPPGFIDGGSPFKYTCTQGEGTNTLNIGGGTVPDTFVSTGDATCTFTGSVTGTKDCQYNLRWSGVGNHRLVACQQQNGDAVVTVSAQCADIIPFGISGGIPTGSPSGTLVCPGVTKVTDFLGIPSINACNKQFGSSNDILFFQVTLAGQNCSQVTNSPAGLKLAALTDLKTEYCHSAGEVDNKGNPVFDCAKKSASADIHNVVDLGECVANPKTLNTDCRPGKDSGVMHVCYVNGQPNVFSFDPNALNPDAVALNGFKPKLDNNDQPLCGIANCGTSSDFRCTFPTCVDGTSVAPDGTLTMTANFLNVEGNTAGGLSCTTTVNTTGK
jgi:hypothetical protein